MCRGVYIPYFKINAHIFEYLNPHVSINKMVNKHTVNYHPSLSELTSRIHCLIFPWVPEGFTAPKYFLNFFSNLYISLWFQKSFKFIMLRLLEDTFLSQKIESVHFCSCPKAKFSPRQKKITHFT